jgi:hypothetical protein
MSNLNIKVHNANGFTKEQLAYYTEAVVKTQRVINSKRFKEKFLKLNLTNNKGMTNLVIYEKMISGAEVLDPVIDNEVDVFITMYYKNNRTVGYTYPSTKETWVNSKFFNQYEHADIGCNLIHEWTHKLGFGHDSAKEHTSVPYATGYLVEDCIREMEKNPDLYKDEEDELPPPIPVEPPPVPVEIPVETPKKKVCKRLWYTLWLKEVCWYE